MSRRRRKIRVLVVDDSPFVRKALTRIMNATDDVEVVECAASAEQALAVIESCDPDVITLDVVMPGADGLEALRTIMSTSPVPVVMVSSLTTSDAPATVEALSVGAVDVIAKPALYPNMNMPVIGTELLTKVRMAAGVDVSRIVSATEPTACECVIADDISDAHPVGASDSLVVIGCSTGGPPALVKLLSAIPAGFPTPILVVQHMPKGFTAALAERLHGLCALEVKEAVDGDLIRAGRVIVAKAGQQMHVTQAPNGARAIRLDRRPPDTPHIPSVDVTMSDAASVYGPNVTAVLLTGMGRDGVEGMRAVQRSGGYTIAESEETSVVWGMPKAAIEEKVVSRVSDLGDIAGILCSMPRIGA